MASKTDVAEVGKMDSPIRRLVFGVRYESQFAVFDRMGSVLDSVLRAKGTPFGPDIFPLSQMVPYEYILSDQESGRRLRMTQSDAILEWPVKTGNLKTVQEVADHFEVFVLAPLRNIGVGGILRYGALLEVKKAAASSYRNPPINRYLSPEFKNANSLAIRFSKRLSSEEALAKKEVKDFRNVIYTLEQSEEGEVSVSLDYQEYFQPLLDREDWSKRPFSKFVGRGIGYFEGEFQSWLEKLIGVPEVA